MLSHSSEAIWMVSTKNRDQLCADLLHQKDNNQKMLMKNENCCRTAVKASAVTIVLDWRSDSTS